MTANEALAQADKAEQSGLIKPTGWHKNAQAAIVLAAEVRRLRLRVEELHGFGVSIVNELVAVGANADVVRRGYLFLGDLEPTE